MGETVCLAEATVFPFAIFGSGAFSSSGAWRGILVLDAVMLPAAFEVEQPQGVRPSDHRHSIGTDTLEAKLVSRPHGSRWFRRTVLYRIHCGAHARTPDQALEY